MANATSIANMLEYRDGLWYIKGYPRTSYRDRYSAYCAAVAMFTGTAGSSSLSKGASNSGVDKKAVQEIVEDLLKKEQSFSIKIENPKDFKNKICGFVPVTSTHGDFKISTKNCRFLSEEEQFKTIRQSTIVINGNDDDYYDDNYDDPDEPVEVYFMDYIWLLNNRPYVDENNHVQFNVGEDIIYGNYYKKAVEDGFIWPLYIPFDLETGEYGMFTATEAQMIEFLENNNSEEEKDNGAAVVKSGQTKKSLKDMLPTLSEQIIKYWQKMRSSLLASFGIEPLETSTKSDATEKKSSSKDESSLFIHYFDELTKYTVIPNEIVPKAYLGEFFGLTDTNLKDYSRTPLNDHFMLRNLYKKASSSKEYYYGNERNWPDTPSDGISLVTPSDGSRNSEYDSVSGLLTKDDYSLENYIPFKFSNARYENLKAVYIPSSSTVFFAIEAIDKNSPCEIVFEKKVLEGPEVFSFKAFDSDREDSMIDSIMGISARAANFYSGHLVELLTRSEEEPSFMAYSLMLRKKEGYFPVQTDSGIFQGGPVLPIEFTVASNTGSPLLISTVDNMFNIDSYKLYTTEHYFQTINLADRNSGYYTRASLRDMNSIKAVVFDLDGLMSTDFYITDIKVNGETIYDGYTLSDDYEMLAIRRDSSTMNIYQGAPLTVFGRLCDNASALPSPAYEQLPESHWAGPIPTPEDFTMMTFGANDNPEIPFVVENEDDAEELPTGQNHK